MSVFETTFSQYFIYFAKKERERKQKLACHFFTEATRTARLQSFDWDEIIMDVENQGAADVQGECVCP